MHFNSLYNGAKIGFFGEYIYLCKDISIHKSKESEKDRIVNIGLIICSCNAVVLGLPQI